MEAIYYQDNGMFSCFCSIFLFLFCFFISNGFVFVLLLLSLSLLLLVVVVLLLLLIISSLLSLSFVLSLALFFNVCIVLYPLISFFIPQAKDQQSNSLLLILTYFIFVTTIFRLIVFKAYDFVLRGGSRTAATSKMERFVIIVNGRKPLTIITKHSILDVAAVLDPPLVLLL